MPVKEKNFCDWVENLFVVKGLQRFYYVWNDNGMCECTMLLLNFDLRNGPQTLTVIVSQTVYDNYIRKKSACIGIYDSMQALPRFKLNLLRIY